MMRTALKAFRRTGSGELRYLWRYHNGRKVVERGVWLTAVPRLVRNGRGKPYKAGFHAFRDQEQADKWLRRCKYPVEFLRVKLDGVIRERDGWLIAEKVFVP